jgi:hypothetical protein
VEELDQLVALAFAQSVDRAACPAASDLIRVLQRTHALIERSPGAGSLVSPATGGF